MKHTPEEIELFELVYNSLMEEPEKWEPKKFRTEGLGNPDIPNIYVFNTQNSSRKNDTQITIDGPNPDRWAAVINYPRGGIFISLGDKLERAIKSLDDRKKQKVISSFLIGHTNPIQLARKALKNREGKND